MFKYDNAVDFVKNIKREHEISLIVSALWQMPCGEVENLKNQFGCRGEDTRCLAYKIFESIK